MLVPRVPTGSKQENVAVRRCTKSGILQLAPSTLFVESSRSDIFGFIISYRVRVKLSVAQTPLKAAVVAEMPIFVVAKTVSEFSHQLPSVDKYPKEKTEKAGSSSVSFRNRRFVILS